MNRTEGRRQFLKRSAMAPGALAAGSIFEHRSLLAMMARQSAPSPDTARGALPAGRIGKLNVTRLICGGNLFSGFAHSGDLLYVSDLLKNYFVENKILDTLQLCEEDGINTAILRTDAHIAGVLKRYRKERGGRIQWIAQTYPTAEDVKTNIQMAIDNGAVGAFVMGGNAERLYKAGKTELIGEAVAFMKRNGLVAGIGSHLLGILSAAENMKIDPDFCFKTLNNVGYESEKPSDIEAYMRAMKKPWIAFKVLGAGRMKPREGFDLAFRAGADFLNVGMYDFQVKEDISLAKQLVSTHSGRERAWA